MVVAGIASLALLVGAAGIVNGGYQRPGHSLRPRGGALRARDFVSYSQSSRDGTADVSFGSTGQTTQVNAGVTRWLSGRGTHNFYGNVNNYGNIIISQTDYLKTASAGGQTSDYSGSDTSNGNLLTGAGSLISLNDYGSASAPTYDWYLNTMQNYGGLQMCGRGDTGGSTYQLYCQQTCYNYGIIDMGQYNGSLGASFVWRNNVLSAPGATNVQNTYNEGLFRITNVVYHNVQNVLGSGCYDIGTNAVLYLEDGSGYYQNVNFGPTFPNQTIYFGDSTGTLHMDTQVYSHNSNFGPQVYNFGPGNAIEFYEVFPSSNVFTYDGTSGILTVRMNSGNSVNIKLGTGYDASQFYVARNPKAYNTGGYNAIFYRGTTPSQSTPTKCSAAVQTCQNPEQTAGTNTNYVTTTVPYTGTSVLTGPVTTTIPPSGTAAGTVEVFTPVSYVTTTIPYTGTSVLTGPVTTTIPPSGTAPGTVEVFTPTTSSDGPYVTTTVPYTGTSVLTGPVTTTIPPSGAAPGTVEVFTPTTSPASSSSRPAVLSTTIGPNQCVCRPRNP